MAESIGNQPILMILIVDFYAEKGLIYYIRLSFILSASQYILMADECIVKSSWFYCATITIKRHFWLKYDLINIKRFMGKYGCFKVLLCNWRTSAGVENVWKGRTIHIALRRKVSFFRGCNDHLHEVTERHVIL